MGMSQVQISRMEKRILKKLREISTNCDAHFAESLFQITHLEKEKKAKYFLIFSRALLGVRI